VALFLFGIALVANLSSAPNFELSFMPWSGDLLVSRLLWINLLGLIAIGLSIAGRIRLLYAIYGIVVFGFAVYGVFFSGHRFDGMDPFKQAIWFLLGALVAMLGSFSQMRARKPY
jgi:hypothetical protein